MTPQRHALSKIEAGPGINKARGAVCTIIRMDLGFAAKCMDVGLVLYRGRDD